MGKRPRITILLNQRPIELLALLALEADFPNLMSGFRFPLDAMWSEVSKLNLLNLTPALEVPVFFFLGREDHWVPPETSVAHFDALTAPSKKLVWFQESGHEPLMDQAAKFNQAMVELVLPTASANTVPRQTKG